MTRSTSLFQNKFSGENLFFTSYTHFSHEGIIKFCNRPFGSFSATFTPGPGARQERTFPG